MFGIDYPELGVGAGVMLGSNMPEAFLQESLERGLFRHDLLVGLTHPDRNWASWHDLGPEEQARPELERITALQATHGISARSVVTFYRGDVRYGGAAFTRAKPFDETEKFILEAATRVLYAELSATYIADMNSHAGLSAGEVSCLRAVAKGLSADDAAKATGFTVETLATYVKSATRKLGAVNRTHAVAEALRRKIID